MFVVMALVGIALILIVLLDAFETIVLPRRVMNQVRLTRLFYRLTWAPWSAIGRRIRSDRKRENFLWLFGPLSLLMLLGVWAVALVIGFALLRDAVQAGQAGSLWHYVYISATTFFLSSGEATPTDSLSRIATVIEGGTGFSFLAL